MVQSIRVSSAVALALAISMPAYAASDADLAEIREQIKALKDSYEARIQALEERLRRAESTGGAAPAVAAAADAAGAAPVAAAIVAPPPPAQSSSISAFNPAVSAVLQGTYARLSQDPSRYRIQNYALTDDAVPGKRGFSLGESELALFANVDDKFAGNLIFSLTPEDTVAVEEAYGIYNAAPFGVVPKFGRFFSGFGYLNEQHQHAWDFYDAPLAYQAFLGGQYANDGLQFKWVAPLDEFLELGAEVGSGASFPGTDRNRNGVGAKILYAHAGGDVGDSHSWRAGVSYLDTRAENREWNQLDALGNDPRLGFDGSSRVAGVDFVWKYAPHGNTRETSFKVQAEYLWRRENGSLTYDRDGAFGPAQTSGYRASQQGGYLQAVWQFMPYWRVGGRYDWLSGSGVDYGDNAAVLQLPPFNPRRYTAMLDYSPSEFSRVRLQLAQSKTRFDATDNELFLQYILSIGAHGAHKF